MNITELKQKWLVLKTSEQRMLILGMSFIIFALLYFSVWKPYNEAIKFYQQQTVYKKEDIAWLTQVGQQIQQLKSGSSFSIGSFTGSFINIVDKSVKQYQLIKFVGVIENSGSDKVLIQFNRIGFNTLIKWLDYIKKRYGILVKNIDLQREADTEKVNARIILRKD